MPAAGRLHLPRGGIARSLAVVGGGTALGQGSIVLGAPILARLYDPQAFGLLSIYTAVISVLLAVASFRFDLAIPTADDADEAAHLLALSVLLALIASATLAVVLLLWGGQLATALGAGPLTSFLWVLPVALLVAGIAQALASLTVYLRAFGALGRMRASQGIAQVVGQAALGFLHAGPFGLVLGDLAGRALGTEQLVRSSFGTLRSTTWSWGSMIRHGRRRWGFARVMTAASVLNMISLQIPFLLIPILFDLDATGQFFLAYRVLVLPASLVSAAVSQVFFGEASRRRGDPPRLHDLALSVAVALFTFSIPTYAIVLVGGQGLIQTVFGSQWEPAGQFAQVLAPSLVLWAVASPISALLLIGRRERESLAFTAADVAIRAAALMIGAAGHSLLLGIVILSVADVLLNLASLWRFLRVATVSLGQLVRPVARIAALTFPFVAVVGIVAVAAPAFVAPAAAIGWAVAFALAVRFSQETRALLSGAHD